MSVQTYAGAATKSCGCAGACGCAAGTCTDGGLARPEFFAGQLLTDEDLQGLVNYVTGANRLHNRNYLGDGVVCGLEVEQDPCDETKLILNPGHAVDCCGNDIVVPCRVTKVDVGQLLQKLRLRLRGGYDCGDPCKDARKGATPTQDQEDGALIYNLYLRFCEQKTDPVTAYTVDDCSPGGCSPTRVQETFTLELDCPAPAATGPDFLKRVEDCWKQTKNQYGALIILPTVNAFATVQTAYRVLVEAEALPQLLHDYGSTSVLGVLKSLTEQISKASTGNPNLRKDALLLLHQGQVWAFRVLYTADFSPIVPDARALIAAIQTVLDRLNLLGVEDPLKPQLAQLNARQKRLADAPVLDPTKWTFDQKSLLIGELTDLNGNVTKDLNDGKATAILDGVKAAFATLLGIRDKLVAFQRDAAIALDPRLLNQLQGLGFPDFPPDGDSKKFHDQLVSARTLNLGVQGLLQDCFCTSLLPPCPTCDDPRVLLATVELDGCTVINVCNLARSFILSGPTLRYWLANFQTIFAPLRGQCCDPPKQKLDKQDADYEASLKTFTARDMGTLKAPPGQLSDDDLWNNVLGTSYPPAADNSVVRGYFGRFVGSLLGLSTGSGDGSGGTAGDASLTVRVDTLEASVGGVQTQVASLGTRVDTLENTTTKGLRDDVTALQGTTTTLTSTVSGLTGLPVQIDLLTRRVEALEAHRERLATADLAADLKANKLDDTNQMNLLGSLLKSRLITGGDATSNPLWNQDQTDVPTALKTLGKFINLLPPDNADGVSDLLSANVGDLAKLTFVQVVAATGGAQTADVLRGLRAAWKTAKELADLMNAWPTGKKIPKLSTV